jgi:DsbC/DsbD-like thiol-disulfide interchange protein
MQTRRDGQRSGLVHDLVLHDSAGFMRGFAMLRSSLFPSAALVCLLAAGAAKAGVASDWSSSGHASIRLLDGGAAEASGPRRAGLDLKLDPGFKTYWRTPGDSGVPPQFDWSGSTNVETVTVQWPAPHRFDDAAGSSIGYSETVLFPLDITLRDPKAPATLRLAFDYAVCGTLCIPARGEATLALMPGLGGSLHSARIEEAMTRVPAQVALGPGPAPAVTAVTPLADALSVAGRIPKTGVSDLFVEGPDGWVFGEPHPVSSRQGPDGSLELVYRVAIEERPDKAASLAGVPVTLTLVTDARAVEVQTRLDGEAPPR